jgi:hypothetical protein
MEVCNCRVLFHFESCPGRWLSRLNSFAILCGPQTTTAFFQIAFVYHRTIWELKLLDVFKILCGRHSLEVGRQFWFWIIISLWAGNGPHPTLMCQSEQTQCLRKCGTKCPFKFVEHEHVTDLPNSMAWLSSFHCLIFRSELFSVRTVLPPPSQYNDELLAKIVAVVNHGLNIRNILCVMQGPHTEHFLNWWKHKEKNV